MILHYTVNNQPYHNVYSAWLESIRTAQPLTFYLNEDRYDTFDWAVEPPVSLNQLMVEHAMALREKHQTLILYYSGGFDSHTIYDVFRTNKIKLDAILVASSDKHPWFPTSVYEWLLKNHWDADTKILNLDSGSIDGTLIFDSEDWIFRDQGMLGRYYNAHYPAVERMLNKEFNDRDWGLIAGYEKPRLIYRQGQWFSRQSANVLDHSFGHQYIEYFYLEPLIAIKQSHLFKNNVKQHIAQNKLPLYDNDWAEAKYESRSDPKSMDSLNYACGRIGELVPGASFLQKKLSVRWCGLSDINHTGPWQEIDSVSKDSKFLIDDLKNGKQTAKNFLRGVYELSNQHTLKSYFRDKNLFTSSRGNLLYDLPWVWSKEYCLGS